jgi:hypothetical protein
MKQVLLRHLACMAALALFTIVMASPLGGKESAARAVTTHAKTVTVWIQVTDSCKQALAGGTFRVNGPGITNVITKPSSGTALQSLKSKKCPVQHGTCVKFATGCTTATLNVPASGIATYTITIQQPAPGRQQTKNPDYGENWTYAVCQGGSDCSKREVATVHVTTSGAVSATVLNTYPNGDTITWPAPRGTFQGTQRDPIMFHEFGISRFSGPKNQCDGDHDADDYMTGSPGSHCKSNSGRKVPLPPNLIP